jgi:hypothetical protein
MLVENPTTRISAIEALTHPYLSKYFGIDYGALCSPCLTGASKKNNKFDKK